MYKVTNLDHLEHYITINSHQAGTTHESVLAAAGLITRESDIEVPDGYNTPQDFLESRYPEATTWYELTTLGHGVLGAALVSHDKKAAHVAEMAIRSDVQRRTLGSILVRHIAQEAAKRREVNISIPTVVPEFAASLGMQTGQNADYAEARVQQLLSTEQ